MKINIGISTPYRCLYLCCFLLEKFKDILYGKKIRNFDSSQKVLKLNTKIKTPCIFRIHIYKTVNEFSMCFSCR